MAKALGLAGRPYLLNAPTTCPTCGQIPPAFDGCSSWFTYEEAIEDWCDLTELDPDKLGPALKQRLEGEAAVYKPLMDRYLLRVPAAGVSYFINLVRPHLVKGAQSVLMWRFFQHLRRKPGRVRYYRVKALWKQCPGYGKPI